jgi:hypothetical protein
MLRHPLVIFVSCHDMFGSASGLYAFRVADVVLVPSTFPWIYSSRPVARARASLDHRRTSHFSICANAQVKLSLTMFTLVGATAAVLDAVQ